MKRSGPLRRKTPLARSTKPMKRTPIRTKPRPADDRVDPALHAHVIARDRLCIGILLRELALTEAAQFGDLRERIGWHQCATRYGIEHRPDDAGKLGVDHFWHDGGHTGDRAPSRPEHLVACCDFLNVNRITQAIREGERRYMAWRVASGRGI